MRKKNTHENDNRNKRVRIQIQDSRNSKAPSDQTDPHGFSTFIWTDWWIHLPWIIRKLLYWAQRGESCSHRDKQSEWTPSLSPSLLSLIHFLVPLKIIHTGFCPKAHLSLWQSTSIYEGGYWMSETGQASSGRVREV